MGRRCLRYNGVVCSRFRLKGVERVWETWDDEKHEILRRKFLLLPLGASTLHRLAPFFWRCYTGIVCSTREIFFLFFSFDGRGITYRSFDAWFLEENSPLLASFEASFSSTRFFNSLANGKGNEKDYQVDTLGVRAEIFHLPRRERRDLVNLQTRCAGI